MLRLALPVIVAEVGWISMGLVDTLMVGRLGPRPSARRHRIDPYMAVMVVGFGTLFALDTFVLAELRPRTHRRVSPWLFAGLQVAAALTVVLTALSMLLVWTLPLFGLHPPSSF
jgi:MATE family multidrug resistance protein